MHLLLARPDEALSNRLKEFHLFVPARPPPLLLDLWCLKCQMLSEQRGLLKQLIRTDTFGIDFSGRKYIFISEREEGHAAQCQETSHPKMSLSRTSHCLINFSLIYSSIHKLG